MEDIIVSKDELIELFETEKIIDTGKGWYMDNSFVNIIALHEIGTKVYSKYYTMLSFIK